jgi:hypothetical protein
MPVAVINAGRVIVLLFSTVVILSQPARSTPTVRPLEPFEPFESFAALHAFDEVSSFDMFASFDKSDTFVSFGAWHR